MTTLELAGLPDCHFSVDVAGSFHHSPSSLVRPISSPPSVEAVEALLSEWFGQPTLLFSSGRAACQLLGSELGLQPYQHRITVPRFLSRCILNSLNMNAFPVHEAGADAVLFYHQYGFRQRVTPREALVIEDACHCFFSGPQSGVRPWVGQGTAFSLPKFFSIHGPAGALVIQDRQLFRRVQKRRDGQSAIDPETELWRRKVIVAANSGADTHLLEGAYALLTEFPGPDLSALAGFPANIDELNRIGEMRAARLRLLAEGLGDEYPAFLMDLGQDLPYALPYFGDGDRVRLGAIADRLTRELGIHAGLYHLDRRCNLYDPDFQPCVLLPCHQYVPETLLQNAISIIRAYHSD